MDVLTYIQSSESRGWGFWKGYKCRKGSVITALQFLYNTLFHWSLIIHSRLLQTPICLQVSIHFLTLFFNGPMTKCLPLEVWRNLFLKKILSVAAGGLTFYGKFMEEVLHRGQMIRSCKEQERKLKNTFSSNLKTLKR